jgi:hypothetical protein
MQDSPWTPRISKVYELCDFAICLFQNHVSKPLGVARDSAPECLVHLAYLVCIQDDAACNNVLLASVRRLLYRLAGRSEHLVASRQPTDKR